MMSTMRFKRFVATLSNGLQSFINEIVSIEQWTELGSICGVTSDVIIILDMYNY